MTTNDKDEKVVVGRRGYNRGEDGGNVATNLVNVATHFQLVSENFKSRRKEKSQSLLALRYFRDLAIESKNL